MRKPPIPRAVPHRLPRERWATAGACGVLALGHATRAAVDAHHARLPRRSSTSVGVVAAVGVRLPARARRRRDLVVLRGRSRRAPRIGVDRVAHRRLPRHQPVRARASVPLLTLGQRVRGVLSVTGVRASDAAATRRRRRAGHPSALRDRDTFEHRRPHTALRELGEERHRLERARRDPARPAA